MANALFGHSLRPPCLQQSRQDVRLSGVSAAELASERRCSGAFLSGALCSRSLCPSIFSCNPTLTYELTVEQKR